MTGEADPGTRALAWFRRHERPLALAWIGATALFLMALALPPTRERLLDGVQRVVRDWDGRWSVALARGDSLVAAGRWTDAETYLSGLDRRFPARTARHAMDKDREHLLLLLGRTYVNLEKKAKALDAYQRLVAFDPNNFRNHYALALASDRLLSGWALALEARDAYAAALAINPSHLPSLRGVIRYDSEKGLFGDARDGYEAYLDAFLAADVRFRAGDSTVAVVVPVDGRWHDVTVPLGQPAGAPATLAVNVSGYPVELGSATFLPALVAGEAGRAAPVVLPVDRATVAGDAIERDGRVLPGALDVTLEVPGPVSPGTSGLHVRLRLFKPVDRDFWETVSAAYRNVLDTEGLALARDRSALYDGADAADQVTGRQEWATEGIEGRPDERVF